MSDITEEGYLRLQQYLDQADQWTKEWQIEFHLDNFNLIMVRQTRTGLAPLIIVLWGMVEKSRDQEVQIYFIKVLSKIDRVLKKALDMIAFISQCIEY